MSATLNLPSAQNLYVNVGTKFEAPLGADGKNKARAEAFFGMSIEGMRDVFAGQAHTGVVSAKTKVKVGGHTLEAQIKVELNYSSPGVLASTITTGVLFIGDEYEVEKGRISIKKVDYMFSPTISRGKIIPS